MRKTCSASTYIEMVTEVAVALKPAPLKVAEQTLALGCRADTSTRCHGSSSILPMWVLASISLCASAASDNGNVL
uniref:Uncharacterized protein n=1 Tax=Arundo donax TaxID=35708 RepID=A0A0A9P0L3_ARUDO